MFVEDDIFRKLILFDQVGDRITVRAQVNRDFNGNTMDVGCRLEKMSLGGQMEHALTAFMSFTTINDETIPYLVPITDDEKRRYEEAVGRRRIRLERKTISSHGKVLSFLWTPENALQLIYSNVRGLMLVVNRSVFAVDEWETISNDGGLKIVMQKQPKLGITCLRIETTIPAKPKDVFLFTLDLSKRKEWDLVIQEAESVFKIDESNDILHFVFKSKPESQPRDFCLLRSWRANTTPGQVEYVVSNRSVIHPLVPVDPRYIRGEVLSSGWIIKDDPNGMTQFTYILQLGSKALSLALGDIVGDSKVIAASLNNVKRIFTKS